MNEFEPIVAGREIGNAFSELTDPEEQRRTFEAQAAAKAAGDAEAYRVETRDALKSTLRRALETVRAGRCAVVDVIIAPISQQVLS